MFTLKEKKLEEKEEPPLLNGGEADCSMLILYLHCFSKWKEKDTKRNANRKKPKIDSIRKKKSDFKQLIKFSPHGIILISISILQIKNQFLRREQTHVISQKL